MWLRVKLTAVFVGLVAIPLTLVLAALWLGGGEVARDSARRDLNEATQSLVAAIEGELARDLAHLKMIAGLPVLQDTLIADDGREIARTLAELKAKHPEFTALAATDGRGVVIATTTESALGRSLANDEGYRRATSGRVHQSALMSNAISFNVPVIAAYDRQTVIGTLAATIDIAALAEAAKAQSTLASRQEAVIVTDRTGHTAFASRADETLLDSIRARAGSGTSVGEIGWRDATHFVSSVPSKGGRLVRDPSFVVHAVRPVADSLAVIDRVLAIAGGVALIAAAAAIALAWRWSTPLVEFGTAMGGLVRGDAGARAPQVAPAHTFAPLVRAFESLRQMRSVHDWRAKRERELQTAKDEAEDALRRKSEHLSSLARSLKEQLSTIVELSEAINIEALSAAASGQRASHAKDISRSGAQLLAVINDLFDLSEAEAGHASLREADVDLAALVRESVEVMDEAAQRAKVVLGCEGTDEAFVVRVDAHKMKQVLFNLLSNAIKFTPEDGRVIAAVKIDAHGRPAIVVRDTGIGMPASLAPMATQAGTSGHGAGFGLPLVRQLVDMHGGAVEIESEPGQGTSVTVALPPDRLVEEERADVRLTA